MNNMTKCFAPFFFSFPLLPHINPAFLLPFICLFFPPSLPLTEEKPSWKIDIDRGQDIDIDIDSGQAPWSLSYWTTAAPRALAMALLEWCESPFCPHSWSLLAQSTMTGGNHRGEVAGLDHTLWKAAWSLGSPPGFLPACSLDVSAST